MKNREIYLIFPCTHTTSQHQPTTHTQSGNQVDSCHINTGLPNRRVAVRRHPHARVVVRVDLVLDELSPPVLVDVDAARLTVVDVTLHHGRVRARLHFEAGDAVVVDVVAFEVALPQNKTHNNTGSFHVKSITFWPFLHHPTPNLMKFSTVVGSHEYIKIKKLNKNLGH